MGNNYNNIKAKNNMEVGRGAEADGDSKANEGMGERPKLQSVVGKTPKKVQKSLFSRLVSGVVGPEGVSGIGGYVTEEIVKPAVKNILFDSITSSISMFLFGDRGMPNRSRGYSNYDNRPRTDYGRSYSQPRPSNDRYYNGRDDRNSPPQNDRNNAAPRGVARYGVDEYTIDNHHDASHVLVALTEYAEKYGSASIADYYDLIRVATQFTDNNYGWRLDAISAARIVPSRGGGFIIKFPPVEVL
jgi:hypothetical protein